MPALRKELANPYSICPEGYAPKVRQPNVRTPQYDADFDAWVAPFVMSAINTRIVQRRNALSKQAYGADFRYDEAMLTGRGIKGQLAAAGVTGGLAAVMVAGALPPTRWALGRFVLPAPGEGPSPEAQRKGYFDLRFLGRTDGGDELRVKVTGDRDPGYGSTAKMLGQAGACLALDFADSGRGGGFWTPATMFGDRLIERLTEHSGLTFEVLDELSRRSARRPAARLMSQPLVVDPASNAIATPRTAAAIDSRSFSAPRLGRTPSTSPAIAQGTHTVPAPREELDDTLEVDASARAARPARRLGRGCAGRRHAVRRSLHGQVPRLPRRRAGGVGRRRPGRPRARAAEGRSRPTCPSRRWKDCAATRTSSTSRWIRGGT